MFHEQLHSHRRNRNLLLAVGWVLVIAGCVSSILWLWGAGGLLLNGYAYYLMAIDKRLAPKRSFRIPEASLFLTAILGGGIGALIGMLTLRHKTKHISFMIVVPVFCILQLFLLLQSLT
ncbi:DUF1294 domain-containing protein [Brevibacillus centrosporus]|uniref:Uncharacterized membrane protein YsdA, DUF1294 family n=1 Tax=Brevibacillus centrosporus TaxID=54910 RepID=A0A1I4D1K1_9BACL|nr:DUF1294 domain-containing protein [Brevibacillus centrosporus]SFK86327.1 Uncharacterized membrane protein YsdA, DUF1294 family [Brevibacillus centrosporus]